MFLDECLELEGILGVLVGHNDGLMRNVGRRLYMRVMIKLTGFGKDSQNHKGTSFEHTVEAL